MSLQNVKADGNVAFRPNRAYYNVIGMNTTLLSQKMASGQSFSGVRPSTVGVSEDDLDPVVSAGRAKWEELQFGGLFDLLGNRKQPLVIESVTNLGAAVLTLVDKDSNLIRSFPTTFPAKVSPGEYIRAIGGATGSEVLIAARIDAARTL